MQLRSGATTARAAPEGAPPVSPQAASEGGIPGQIQIASPPRQEDDVDVPITVITVVPIPRTPAQTPQVHTAGTYVANLGRSPSEPANFRPAQFSFLPQPDFRTAGEPPSKHGDAGSNQDKLNTTPRISNQPAVSPPHDPYKGREIIRTFVFEATIGCSQEYVSRLHYYSIHQVLQQRM
jgi:hypothetical protein